MKNIKVENGNIVVCLNNKYHLELTAIGTAAAKCGWSKFPTMSAWVKAGGVEDDRMRLLDACNAVHKHMDEATKHSAEYGKTKSEEEKKKSNAADMEAQAAIKNLTKMLGVRVDRRGNVRTNAWEVDIVSMRCLYKLCQGKEGVLSICSPETFAMKVVPFVIYMMKGEKLTVDKAVKNENSSATNKPRETIKDVREQRDAAENKLVVSEKKLETAEEKLKSIEEQINDFKQYVMTTTNPDQKELLDRLNAIRF